MRHPSAELLDQIRGWLADAKAGVTGVLNADGSGVMVYGDIGGAAYIRADGSIEIESSDDFPGNAWSSDPNVRTMALVCASERRPILRELLPERPTSAGGCVTCNATGWMSAGGVALMCETCHGLGWVSLPNSSLERTRER